MAIPTWLAPVAISALGALAGSRGGGDITQTQTMIPPPLTSQQQIMLNQLTNWLYQAAPQYQSYIDQTLAQIYGGTAAPGIAGGTTGLEGIPGQLGGELGAEYEEAVQTKAGYQRDIESYEAAEDIIKSMDTYINFFKNVAANTGRDYKQMIIESLEHPSDFKDLMQSKHGLDPIRSEELVKVYLENPETFKTNFLGPKPAKPSEAVEPTPEAQAAAKETWSPFGEIMSWTPERISEYYGIERAKGLRELEDWYNQALREAEQRATAQYGGYLGSAPARDIDILSAERQKRTMALTEALRQSELAHLERKPYEMLQAATGLISNLSGMQAPWLQLGSQLTQPYGATTTIATQPGASSLQGMLSGAMTGLGIAGMGQGLGWWGKQPPVATPWGLGMIGSPTTMMSQPQMSPMLSWPW